MGEIENLRAHFDMPESIIVLKSGIKVYVPQHLDDYIQKQIVIHKDFYERKLLDLLINKYEVSGTVLDIGANIGNHSLYFANSNNVTKVYAFEPVKDTFKTLERNITLNNMQKKISAYNIALGAQNTRANICHFNEMNIGASRVKEDYSGEIEVCSLDSLNKVGFIDSIALIKIDVEGFEFDVLKGGEQLIKAHKPIIFVESFGEAFSNVKKLLKEFGYTLDKKLVDGNYIFTYSG